MGKRKATPRTDAQPARWLNLADAVALIADLEKTDAATAKRLLIEALQDGLLTARSRDRHDYPFPVSILDWREKREAWVYWENPGWYDVPRRDVLRLWGPDTAPTFAAPELAAAVAIAEALARAQRSQDAKDAGAFSDKLRKDHVRMMNAEREKAEKTAERWRRTGLAGRTRGGSKECILEELARRADRGTLEATAADQARVLLAWHESDAGHKPCAPLRLRSAVEYIGKAYRDAKRPPGKPLSTKSTAD